MGTFLLTAGVSHCRCAFHLRDAFPLLGWLQLQAQRLRRISLRLVASTRSVPVRVRVLGLAVPRHRNPILCGWPRSMTGTRICKAFPLARHVSSNSSSGDTMTHSRRLSACPGRHLMRASRPHTCLRGDRRDGGRPSYSFDMVPSDPDSPYDLGAEGINLIVTMPVDYPKSPASFEVNCDAIEFPIRRCATHGATALCCG